MNDETYKNILREQIKHTQKTKQKTKGPWANVEKLNDLFDITVHAPMLFKLSAFRRINNF